VASAAGFTTTAGEGGTEERGKFTLVLTGGLLAEGGVITHSLIEQLALSCPLAVPVHPKVRVRESVGRGLRRRAPALGYSAAVLSGALRWCMQVEPAVGAAYIACNHIRDSL